MKVRNKIPGSRVSKSVMLTRIAVRKVSNRNCYTDQDNITFKYDNYVKYSNIINIIVAHNFLKLAGNV